IVESEKTAVIMSEISDHPKDYPSNSSNWSESPIKPEPKATCWLASGGLTALTPQMFLPLKGRKIILFPDTDPNQEAYNLWKRVALKAEELIQTPIYVSDILERLATPTQKERKIDVADLIDNGQRTTDNGLSPLAPV
ncbi:MAG: hypothetical protein KBT15_01050, partial [Bacteroidales bacterium]|nr:hypothetical protein [Candidatus Minthousia equi]